MKFVLVQENPIVGDLQANTQKVIQTLHQLHSQQKTQESLVVIFSELFLIGYPAKDLLYNSNFIKLAQQKIVEISEQIPSNIHLFLGAVSMTKSSFAVENLGYNCLYNSVYYLNDHKVKKIIPKRRLPHYDIFNERRYFLNPAELNDFSVENITNNLVTIENKTLLITICEDIWGIKDNKENNERNTELIEEEASHKKRRHSPHWLKTLFQEKENSQYSCDLVINIAASPFTNLKHQQRMQVFENLLQKIHKPFLYINQIGANDSLIFDGYSLVIKPTKIYSSDNTINSIKKQGKNLSLTYLAKGFCSDILTVDSQELFSPLRLSESALSLLEQFQSKTLQNKTPFITQKPALMDLPTPPPSKYAFYFESLLLGIKDYIRKNSFKEVILGLSGGIDSALVATLSVAALGSENVYSLALPSPYNSPQSLTDAQTLAKNLQISLEIINIESIFSSYLIAVENLFKEKKSDTTEENIQSRIRGTLLMAMSNKFNYLLLSTGNKSELAVGYCTLYGDMNGCLAPIGDLYKTEVFELCQWINLNTSLQIPQGILNKEPSAELSHNQKDSDSLPPYELLDQILYLYLEKQYDTSQIVSALDTNEEVVEDILNKVKNNEFKRYQSPPILKISQKSFGEGRLIPLTQNS